MSEVQQLYFQMKMRQGYYVLLKQEPNAGGCLNGSQNSGQPDDNWHKTRGQRSQESVPTEESRGFEHGILCNLGS